MMISKLKQLQVILPAGLGVIYNYRLMKENVQIGFKRY